MYKDVDRYKWPGDKEPWIMGQGVDVEPVGRIMVQMLWDAEGREPSVERIVRFLGDAR